MQSKKNINIFLVDDNPMCLALYSQHLQNSGIGMVETFDDADSCLGALHYVPDIVFLDYHLLAQNGLELLKKIKKHNHHIYVVMLSVEKDQEIAKKALQYGAFDYIIKGEKELQKMDRTIEKILYNKKLLSIKA